MTATATTSQASKNTSRHHKKTAITAALAAVVIAASGSVAGVFDPRQGGTRPTGGDADTAPAVGATLTALGTPRGGGGDVTATPLVVLGLMPPGSGIGAGAHPVTAAAVGAARRLGGNGATTRVVGPNFSPNPGTQRLNSRLINTHRYQLTS